MNQVITREQVKKLVGKQIVAVRQDGTVVKGKLRRLKGNELVLEQAGGKVKTKAIIPLVLFDLLAIGTSPFGYGGYGGYGGYPGYGYGGYGYGGYGGYPGIW